MNIGISTRWNAYRHKDGRTMIDEIKSMGFDHVELGYDLTADLVEGVVSMVREKIITVDSVHNFCPVPPGVPHGHPELFELASPEIDIRKSAIRYTLSTVDFAANLGAKFVVVHVGRVNTRITTRRLISMWEGGKYHSPRYERLRTKLIIQREKKAKKRIDAFCQTLDEMLPQLERTGVALAIEVLPSWEAVPTEPEMLTILREFNSPFIRYWHDTGHAQTRENLGFIGHRVWFEKLLPWLAGMHIHDIRCPAFDHLMPPMGELDFSTFNLRGIKEVVRVLEPAPGTPVEIVKEAHQFLEKTWQMAVPLHHAALSNMKEEVIILK